MNETEDPCFGRKFREGIKTVLELLHIVALKVFAGNVKDIDQNLHVLKNVLTLRQEELLHEKILTTTIPKR